MSANSDHTSFSVYFGTADNNCRAAEGVYHTTFSPTSGSFAPAELLVELAGAGWVSLHPQLPGLIYSTGEINGKTSIVAISTTETPKILNHQPTGDGESCFVTADQTGTLLFSAQYFGGSIGVYPLEADGSIGTRLQLLKHSGGSNVVADRQDAPHPHSITVSPDNRFAFAPDLGLDQLVGYQIDLVNKKLQPHPAVDVVPGGGARHMKFHPGGKFAFVLNELSLSLTSFRYNATEGTMEKIETVETLTAAEKSETDFNSASEIRIGQENLIYTGHRGHDSISVFRFNVQTESLHRIQLAPIHGSWPRNFNVTTDGRYLMAAGQYTNSISLFRCNSVEQDNGGVLRHQENKEVFVPGPICVAIRE